MLGIRRFTSTCCTGSRSITFYQLLLWNGFTCSISVAKMIEFRSRKCTTSYPILFPIQKKYFVANVLHKTQHFVQFAESAIARNLIPKKSTLVIIVDLVRHLAASTYLVGDGALQLSGFVRAFNSAALGLNPDRAQHLCEFRQ